MKYLDLNFAEPAQNLACDEALLSWFEAQRLDGSLLRLWEPENYFVVLGHSNRLRREVNAERCAAEGLAILRRVSGGGTVVQGPGCLNYSLILSTDLFPGASIPDTFDFVLQRHRALVQKLTGAAVQIQGISDLTIAGRKFSGNAQYRKRTHVLVHGTFLLTFDLSLMERCLLMPERQPEYRRQRAHGDFIVNLKLDPTRLRRGLIEIWRATEPLTAVPVQSIEDLARERYRQASWTEKF